MCFAIAAQIFVDYIIERANALILLIDTKLN